MSLTEVLAAERSRVAGAIDELAFALVSTGDDAGTALTAAVLQRAAEVARTLPDECGSADLAKLIKRESDAAEAAESAGDDRAPLPPGTLVTRTEWGIGYGDGEVEDHFDRDDAEIHLETIRRSLAAGTLEPDDYEPMALVRRTVVTSATAWEQETR